MAIKQLGRLLERQKRVLRALIFLGMLLILVPWRPLGTLALLLLLVLVRQKQKRNLVLVGALIVLGALLILVLWRPLGTLALVLALALVAKLELRLRALALEYKSELFLPKRKYKSSVLTGKLAQLLPEDWRADIESERQRLLDAGKPNWFIKLSTIRRLIDCLRAAIQINLENFWLPAKVKLRK